LFGLPVSEPFFDDDGVSTQVFQNAVLEDLGFDGVRLRDIGQVLIEQAGLAGDPAFKPAPPAGGTTFLVDADDGLRLRGGPAADAAVVMVLPNNAEFIAVIETAGTAASDWIPGYADGFAGWVSATFLTQPPPLPQLDPALWDPAIWQGAALSETNVRAEPSTTSRTVEELEFGDPLTVRQWVAGEEVFEGANLWAQLGERRYVYARNVGRNAPVLPIAPPPDAPTWGKWIDIHLTQQLMTVYDGITPLRTVVITTGMAGWETPPGLFYILHRVANETMTNDAIGAENFYRLEDVLFTQYFTDRGHALHFAWWRTPETIGRPGSHGCINMLLEDARYLWDWAEIGTAILIRR
nr:L,D-transpeptidase family protein [Chloroflexia bacterium]